MKKFISPIIISLLLTIANFNLKSQQIPNSNFENWTGSSLDGWTNSVTPPPPYPPINITTATKTSNKDDVYEGNYAVQMKTKDLMGYVIPGIVQLGNIDIENEEPYGGIPFTAIPKAVQVFLKYDQQANDSAIIAAYLSKYNPKTKKSERFYGAFQIIDYPVPEYRSFIVPFYKKEGEDENKIPDTLNIAFFSSYRSPHAGSTLIIDKVTLLYEDYFLPPNANVPTEITENSFNAEWVGSDLVKEYILDIATDQDFNNPLPGFKDLNVGDTLKHQVTINDTSTKYIYYRIKANYGAITSDYSNVMSFPVPHSPTCFDAEKITAKGFTATWQNIPTAKNYYFFLATDPEMKNNIPDYHYYITTKNKVEVVGLQANTDYYYTAKARYYIAGNSKTKNIIKVTTPSDDLQEKFLILRQKEKIIFFSDSSYYNSKAQLFTTNGSRLWTGILKDRYTEIKMTTSQYLILYIEKPNGTIIKKKIGVAFKAE